MTLGEMKLRKLQCEEFSATLKERGVIGLEGLSVRYKDVSLVHMMSDKPEIKALWNESIEALAQDYLDEANFLAPHISKGQEQYDNTLALAKEAAKNGDAETALKHYTNCYWMEPTEMLAKVVKQLKDEIVDKVI